MGQLHLHFILDDAGLIVMWVTL